MCSQLVIPTAPIQRMTINHDSQPSSSLLNPLCGVLCLPNPNAACVKASLPFNVLLSLNTPAIWGLSSSATSQLSLSCVRLPGTDTSQHTYKHTNTCKHTHVQTHTRANTHVQTHTCKHTHTRARWLVSHGDRTALCVALAPMMGGWCLYPSCRSLLQSSTQRRTRSCGRTLTASGCVLVKHQIAMESMSVPEYMCVCV